MGVTKTDFSRLADRPGEAPLEPHEKKMLTFVLSAMEDPETIDAGRISRLKNAGWTDADILDALAQGVGMIDHNIFMRVFTAET